MITDQLILSSRNLAKRPLRSWLTVIGIIIGVAAIVGLISLGEGLKAAITDQFSGLGTDLIAVQGKSAAFGPPGSSSFAKLADKDVDTIKRVQGVQVVAGRLLKSVTVEFNDKVTFPFAASIPKSPDARKLVEQVNRLSPIDGRLLISGDRKKVLAGNNYADKNIFGKAVTPGDAVLINGESFEVVGVLEKTGRPAGDGVFFLPDESMRDLLGIGDEHSLIAVQVSAGASPEKVAEDLTRALRTSRGLKEGKEDFTVQTPQQILESVGTILSIVQAVLVGIAAISLIVGGIGITNTMYTAVLERTNEIGVLKAVGARNKDILLLFMIESGLIGLVGGIVGVLIGMGMSKLVVVIASQFLSSQLLNVSFNPSLIIGTLLFTFIVGSISGILPAYQASRVPPVEALRYE